MADDMIGLMVWLGPAAGELTSEQIERVAEASCDIDERYPHPDEQEERETALIAAVEYLLGKTRAEEVKRERIEAKRRERLTYVTALQVAVMMVRDGQQKKGSAAACGVDRQSLLRALGERD